MALPPLVNNIVGFLRAGYPEGVPEHDYLPLFALLTRQLTDDEVIAVADELDANGDQNSATRDPHRDPSGDPPDRARQGRGPRQRPTGRRRLAAGRTTRLITDRRPQHGEAAAHRLVDRRFAVERWDYFARMVAMPTSRPPLTAVVLKVWLSSPAAVSETRTRVPVSVATPPDRVIGASVLPSRLNR